MDRSRTLSVLAAMVAVLQADPAHAAGAIAVGRCGEIGNATDLRVMSTARAAALAWCAQKDTECKVVKTIRNTCVTMPVDLTCNMVTRPVLREITVCDSRG